MSTPVRCAVTAIFVLGFTGANAIADGAALYRAHCAICHGDVTAPRFVGRSVDDVKRTITDGKGKMRPIALSPAEIDAIASFVAFPNPGGTAASTSAAGPNPAAMKKIASGDRFVAAKDDKQALYAYLDAVNLDSSNVEARLKLAAQYLRMGHPAQAMQQWELVLALEPGNEEAARHIREARAPQER
jgi:Cytochrome C oxidase, cbb3-type, subunit III